MKYAPKGSGYRVILGPCRCQGCGEPLWWVPRQTRKFGLPAVKTTWREEDGAHHICPNFPPINARKAYHTSETGRRRRSQSSAPDRLTQ